MIRRSTQLSSRFIAAIPLLLTLAVLSGCANPNGVTGVATPTLIPTLDEAAFTNHAPKATTAEATPEAATAEAAATETATDNDASATETVAETPSSETAVEAAIFFAQPTNHALLPISSTVVMGVEGLVVQPAGEVVDGAGHLHLLIDSDFVPAGEVIPKDEEHLHFGDGSSAGQVNLVPGEHTLRIQFADGAHIALDGDQYRAEIDVTVSEDAAEQAVYFVTPQDGDVVTPSFNIVMGATGLIVEPAGEVRDGAGHMHLLIDTDFVPVGEAVPKDETHRHFGGGQTETTLELEPGEHLLRLQFTNGAHIVLPGEHYQDEITIVVEEP